MVKKKVTQKSMWIGVSDDGTIVVHKDFKTADQWAKDYKEENDNNLVYVFEVISAYYADFPTEPMPELIKMSREEMEVL